MIALAKPDRPLRADAARNRARVLEVAYDTFASEGLAVPIDEIARRAGVGAGTVYRHFPTKEDLYRAVVEDRICRIVDEGRELLATGDPEALYVFLRRVVLQWGATDRGLADALAGVGVDIKTAMPEAEGGFIALLDDLAKLGQKAGTVRQGIVGSDIKAILSGSLAMQASHPDAAARLTDVILDGLRPR